MTPAQGLKRGPQETAEWDLLLQSLRPSRIGGDGQGLCVCEETAGGSQQGLRRTPLRPRGTLGSAGRHTGGLCVTDTNVQ